MLALEEALPARCWSEYVQVFRLEVQRVRNGDTFWIQPVRATLAPAPARASRRAAAEDGRESD
eukprot:1726142-Alexandrium_andersonii.AAC.1